MKDTILVGRNPLLLAWSRQESSDELFQGSFSVITDFTIGGTELAELKKQRETKKEKNSAK
jgi:hypothetical protein